MSAAPTICKACGQPMPPTGSSVCEKCERFNYGFMKNDERLRAEHARPDDNDLTGLLWRLPQKLCRLRYSDYFWQGFTKGCGQALMFGLPAAALFMFVYWLGKQAGLWG